MALTKKERMQFQLAVFSCVLTIGGVIFALTFYSRIVERTLAGVGSWCVSVYIIAPLSDMLEKRLEKAEEP